MVNPTVKSYEPPLSPDFVDAFDFWKCGHRKLAQGVCGIAFEKDGLIYIPLIVAKHEGAGDVGRFLDSLSARCRIITVTSERLEGMLKRRGWTSARHEEYGDIWERA